MVNIWWMLDWLLSQNCRNTIPLQTVDQLASSTKNKRLLWLVGIKYVKTRTYCEGKHLIAQCGETRIYVLKGSRAENGW